HHYPVHVAARIGEMVQRRFVRRDGEAVEREPENAALFLDHADDVIRYSADPQIAADRIQIRKEILRDLIADDDDGRAELRFLVGEQPSGGDVVLLDREV